MKRKGKGRGIVIQLALAMPILTVLLAILGAKLVLSQMLPEDGMQIYVYGMTGVISFVLCIYSALRMPQKKFLWGMLTAAAYACMLLLGNLLFFGIGYKNILPVILSISLTGVLGSFLGAAKRRKIA